MKRLLLVITIALSLASIQVLSMFAFSAHMSNGMDMSNSCPLPMVMKGQCAPTDNPLWVFDHHVESIAASLTSILPSSDLDSLLILALVALSFVAIGFLVKVKSLKETFFWKKHNYWRQIIYISRYKFNTWIAKKFRKLETLQLARVYTYS